MATSKKTTKKESDKTVEPFDLNTAMKTLEMPNMFKAGLGYYIESQKLTVKSQKDFEKTINDYSKLTLGE